MNFENIGPSLKQYEVVSSEVERLQQVCIINENELDLFTDDLGSQPKQIEEVIIQNEILQLKYRLSRTDLELGKTRDTLR